MMGLTLYKKAPSPPSRAAHMVAEILGLDIDYVDVDLAAGEHKTPEYLKKNPLHTIPVLEDGGFALSDSNAIAAYLVDKYGKNDSLYPKDLQKRATINQMLHFNSGILFPNFRATSYSVIFEGVTKVTEERLQAMLAAVDKLEALLANKNGGWLAGDQLTIADICCLPTANSYKMFFAIDDERFPKTKAWLDKCSKLPVFTNIEVPGYKQLEQWIKSKLK